MDIALIIQLVGYITTLIPAAQKIISDLQQSGEMTPDQSAALDAAILGTLLDPAWKPDDAVPAPPTPAAPTPK